MANLNLNNAVMTFPTHVRMWAHPGITSSIHTKEDEEKLLNETDAVFKAELETMRRSGREIGPKEHEEVGRRLVAEFSTRVTQSTEHPYKAPFVFDYVCHNEALDRVENFCRSKMPLQNITVAGFIKLIKLIHSHVINPQNPRKVIGGEYRKLDVRIVKSKELEVYDGTFRNFIKEKHPEEWSEDLGKYEDNYSIGISYELMVAQRLVQKETLATIRKYFHIPPTNKRVDDLMNKMIEELQRVIKVGDSIKAACFAHMGIVNIHPFMDANGRIARIFMNLVLMQGGHQPVSFAFDSVYTQAVQAEQEGKLGAFEHLVRPLVAKFDRMFQYEALAVKDIDPDLMQVYKVQYLWKEGKGALRYSLTKALGDHVAPDQPAVFGKIVDCIARYIV